MTIAGAAAEVDIVSACASTGLFSSFEAIFADVAVRCVVLCDFHLEDVVVDSRRSRTEDEMCGDM